MCWWHKLIWSPPEVKEARWTRTVELSTETMPIGKPYIQRTTFQKGVCKRCGEYKERVIKEEKVLIGEGGENVLVA